jgi:hypothetical protein
VFVDYNNNGRMERLPVTDATASAGTVTKIPNNDNGVWIAGNARSTGSFSATVQLFTTMSNVGGACAYASNYPPVGKYLSASEISFTGTPEYKVILERSNKSTYTVTVGKNESLLIPNGEAALSFTDKTGAPGKIACIPSTVYDLTASALSFCEGDAGVTFALSGTDDEQSYELYRDGMVVATLEGTGSAATFSGFFQAGTYTARTVPGGTFCLAEMNGSLPIGSNPLPDAPAMGGGGTYCSGMGTITATAGSGGTGIRWTDEDNTASSRTVTASGTYYAVSTTEAGCESLPEGIAVVASLPGADGQPAVPCGCVPGTIDCTGTCRTDTTYEEVGECSGTCETRCTQIVNVCGDIIDPCAATKKDCTCRTGCSSNVTACCGENVVTEWCEIDDSAFCTSWCAKQAAGFMYWRPRHVGIICYCYRCNTLTP